MLLAASVRSDSNRLPSRARRVPTDLARQSSVERSGIRWLARAVFVVAIAT